MPVRQKRYDVLAVVKVLNRYDVLFDQTLSQPEFIVPGFAGRQVLMRRYFDAVLDQAMLLRVVIEETETERVVVAVYKTS